MPSRFWDEGRSGLPGFVLLILVSILGTSLLYWDTREFGLDYDDYHFVRPYSRAEVLAAFHGTWDPTGIEVPFYRPLTVAFYAARFELFGLNARAHHDVSLALFACAAILVGLFGWWTTGRSAAGILAGTLFIVHPSMPYAQVAWITNQMHLLQTLVVLVALLWWMAVRGRGLGWWLPLLALGAAAFLVKEDGIMLLPAILVLHGLRRRLAEPTLPPAPRAFIGAAVALGIGLIALRSMALGGEVGGYGRPTAEQAWRNYVRGLDSVLRLVPADRRWQLAASSFVTCVPLLALVCWRRTTPGARAFLATGAAIALLFNVPFVFVTKIQQMHLVALGAALLLAGAGSVLACASPRRPVRAAVTVGFAGGIAAMGAVAKDISRDFAPFGPIVRYHDSIVMEWAAVPQELRDYLRRKLQPGAETAVSSNPVEALTVVGWGLHPVEKNSAGVEYRWMSGPRAEIHVSPHVRDLSIPFRHEIGAFREPANVRIQADGRLVDTLLVADDGWRTSRVRLGALPAPGLRRLHRVVISIDRAWVPALLHRHSKDRRVLGLQIGAVQLR